MHQLKQYRFVFSNVEGQWLNYEDNLDNFITLCRASAENGFAFRVEFRDAF